MKNKFINKSIILFLIILNVCSILIGCNSTRDEVSAGGIKLNATEVTLYRGDSSLDTYSLKVAFYPENVSNRVCNFESSNTNVVTVGNAGLVRAVSVGEAEVKVTSLDGNYTTSCKFIVKNIEPNDVGFNVPVVVKYIGDGNIAPDGDYYDTFDLKASVMPNNTIDKSITFTSNNTDIVQVDQNGLLTINTSEKAHTTVTVDCLANGFSKDIDIFVDSYVLETARDLDHIRYRLDGRFELGSNIDLENYDSIGNEGKGWLPIGTEEEPFTGTIIGNGFSIVNMEIYHVVQANIGLFGYTEGAILREFSLQDVMIDTKYQTSKKTIYAGPIVSVNGPGSTIYSCYTSGQMRVDNDESCAGGIVSENYGIISNCYSTVSVSLSGNATYAGGLAGNTIGGTIEYSYATGGVFGVKAGSISGYSEVYVVETNGVYTTSNPKYLSCFFDSSSTGIGVPLSSQSKSAAMQDMTLDKISFTNEYFENWNQENWEFTDGYYPRLKKLGEQKSVDKFTINENVINLENYENEASIFDYLKIDYGNNIYSHKNIKWTVSDPSIINIAADGRLYAYKSGTVDVVGEFENNVSFNLKISCSNPEEFFTSGLGTLSDPFVITTAEQFNDIRNYLGYNFILGSDIDLSVYGKNHDKKRGWKPIGDSVYRFLGSLDGNGYKIKNLYINHGYTTFVGLFGMADGARFKNICLENIDITTTATFVGGLVAINVNGAITESFISGSITNNEERALIGGFCCENYGSIMNSISNVDITAKVDSSVIGGIVGDNFNAVTYCLSFGTYEGNKNTKIGAICGAIKGSNNPIISCYFNIDDSNTTYGLGKVDNYTGIVGLTTDQLKEGLTHEQGSMYFENYSPEIWEFKPGSYPRLKNIAGYSLG